jgi:hypothetical protein
MIIAMNPKLNSPVTSKMMNQPEPLNRIPHRHQGLPAPAWHDPLPDGRVKGACGAAARALRAPMTRPPARSLAEPGS